MFNSLLLLEGATLLLYAIISVILWRGNRKLLSLSTVEVRPAKELPSVSIIVAARNEERNLRQALTSLLQLDYPELELIVVNDRSEDSTGEILTGLEQEFPHLKIVTLESLPLGWLGKNHALWQGVAMAQGELLLFTDADIVMAPDTLRRAVSFLLNKNLDHLAVSPRTELSGLMLRLFVASFIAFFFPLFVRPWKVNDPRSGAHIGIGAFNLVRRCAYTAVGGHQSIALRPDDDLKLGKILKKGGFRQDVALGREFLCVEWYSSLRELIQGLEKNLFAGTDYRLWLIACGVVFHLLFSLAPYLVLFLGSGLPQILAALSITLLCFSFASSVRFHAMSPWLALGYPLAAALFIYLMLRTTLLNLWQGGIYWRGTFYPLDQLKRNRV
ncbi:MAG: glycosyl transferase [Desulfuromonas sp.]|nr:MAG: glycosyl transferase [Desulfuromonas sp.]